MAKRLASRYGWQWWLGCVGWMLAVGFGGGLFSHLWVEASEEGYLTATNDLVADLGRELNQLPPASGAAVNSTGGVPRDADGIRVSILSFTDLAGAHTRLGGAVAATIADNINRRIPNVRLVNREALDKVFDEQDLNDSGRVAKKTGARIGKLTGADYLLTGRSQITGDRIIVNLTLINTTTGEIRWARTVDSTAPRHLIELARTSTSSPESASRATSTSGAFATLLREFLIKNWQWLWTVVLVPLFALALTRKRPRARQPRPVVKESDV